MTFGAPINLLPGEDKRAFLDRAREAVVAMRPGGHSNGAGVGAGVDTSAAN